jgi:hypothetical protein
VTGETSRSCPVRPALLAHDSRFSRAGDIELVPLGGWIEAMADVWSKLLSRVSQWFLPPLPIVL